MNYNIYADCESKGVPKEFAKYFSNVKDYFKLRPGFIRLEENEKTHQPAAVVNSEYDGKQLHARGELKTANNYPSMKIVTNNLEGNI